MGTKALLARKEYAEHEQTQQLLALCRWQIVDARTALATKRSLSNDQRREQWGIIDARIWFVEMVAKDYDAELVRIERDLEAELARV